MKEKDTYTFQVERVRRVVEENWPGKIVEVDPSPLAIRFRVMEPAIGTELARVLEHWEPSEFADKFPTDKDLSKFIKTRSNGLL